MIYTAYFGNEMSLSTKTKGRRHIGFRLLLAVFVILGSTQATARGAEQRSDPSTGSKAHDQATETVSEGRSAVDFYRDPAVRGEDAWRLSDEFVQYPLEPVDRLRPLLEIGDPFLGSGPIRPGVKTPTGQMLQPSFLLFGTFRSALQSFDSGDENTVEWSNRLDLHGNLNLSGTERLLFSMRPLDRRTGDYTGYNFYPKEEDGWREDFNARLTQLYFEGDIGEIFPRLDPTDSRTFDVGFSIGRQPLMVQDGLLLNDIIDVVGITRNSLVFPGVSNLSMTGIFGWNHISRGNNDRGSNPGENSAKLFGLLSQADTAWNNTLALDLIYIDDNHDESAWYVGAASTQRLGSLNTTFRVTASIPEHEDTLAASGGVLLLSQLSSTLSGSDNLAYLNTFWNIDQFTSAARGPDQSTPVANLGILYAPVGMGSYGVPLGQPIDDTVGTAIGYQMFLDGIDSQLILELGARTSTKSSREEDVLGLGARYQRAIGRHHVLRLDAFVAAQEGDDLSYGLRTEWMIKF
ncbi:MAG: hypothetical protein ACREYF_21860 [Gammaproteobacteria bacterium]